MEKEKQVSAMIAVQVNSIKSHPAKVIEAPAFG